MFSANLAFLLVAASAVVASPVPQSTDNTPACVALCVSVKFQEANYLAPTCQATDVGCLCAQPTFINAYSQCLIDNCRGADVQTGADFGLQLCANAGIGLNGQSAVTNAEASATAAAAVSSFINQASSSAASVTSEAAAEASSVTSELAASASSAQNEAESSASSVAAEASYSASSAAAAASSAAASATSNSLAEMTSSIAQSISQATSAAASSISALESSLSASISQASASALPDSSATKAQIGSGLLAIVAGVAALIV